MLTSLSAAFELHWVLLYFGILGACAYLWVKPGGVGFEESERD